jgi:hypothetical protein
MNGNGVAELLIDGDGRNGPPPVVSKAAFAEELGLTKARISQLIGLGLPVRPDGRLDRGEALAWYRANMSKTRRKTLRPADAEIEDPKRELLRLKIETAALELEKARGVLIDRAAAEKAIFERARLERDAHLAWISRAAPELAAETGADPRAAFAALDRLMREHLAQLAETPCSPHTRG